MPSMHVPLWAQVTPMTALHMVWNVLLAKSMNDEDISPFVMVSPPT